MQKVEYIRPSVPILYDFELPECLSRLFFYHGDGYSFYRGVLVLWDEDHDERILTFIDNNRLHIADLLVAQEHKAYLSLAWLDRVPEEFIQTTIAPYHDQVEVAGDMWHCESIAIDGKVWLPTIKAVLARF